MASGRAKARATSPVSARIVVKTTQWKLVLHLKLDIDLGIANPPTPAPTEATIRAIQCYQCYQC